MQLEQITPLILTFNEEPNLRRTLHAISWAKQIVIIDSGSTDGTLAITKEFPNTPVYHRRFDDHTSQWNFGLDQIKTEWVLTLDADYVCLSDLSLELTERKEFADVYFASIAYCIYGTRLRHSLYPPRAVLFRPSQCKYVDDGHTQLLDVNNRSHAQLRSSILHDDWKPLKGWFQSQARYAELEAAKILAIPQRALHWKDRIRKMIVFGPVLTFFYCLFVKGLAFNGWAGWYYTLQRVLAEVMLSLTLLDMKLKTKPKSSRPPNPH